MTEETQVTQSTPKSANPYLMPGAIVVAGILISIAVFVSNGSSKSPVAGETEIKSSGLSITETDHVFGPKNPDVYFIEYSDYRCGYCGLFNDTIKTVIEGYDGKIAWVYRHSPYQPGGKEAAVASECIAELVNEDAFWQFTELAFKNQKLLSADWLKKTAVELGADETKFTECTASGKYDELIATQTFEAQELGGNGTPFNVLLTKKDGVVKFSGAQPIESVKIFVNRALKTLE
jgi:protein-disulfide isomerase